MCLAIPGKIIRFTNDEGSFRSGLIDFSGVSKEINLAYVPEAVIGDYVIVHAGLAISTIDEQEAKASLKAFQQLSESQN